MHGLINPGAADLFLGRFGCSGHGSPRTRAKSLVGEEVNAVEQLVFAPHNLPI